MIGDVLRNIALIVLIFYVSKNNIKVFQLFLILYCISSALIGYYAFTHSLKNRAYSEWFGGGIVLYLFITTYYKLV
jgi:hypothetical protein